MVLDYYFQRRNAIRRKKYHSVSRDKINRIILHFWLDITRSTTVKLIGINCNAVVAECHDFPEKIMKEHIRETAQKEGLFEVDEPYFGARRARVADKKTPGFGLLKRNNKGYVRIVPNYSKESWIPIIVCKDLCLKAQQSFLMDGRCMIEHL